MAGPLSDTDDEYVTLGLCASTGTEDLSALTSAEIRRAYRAAALLHHPDKNPHDPQGARDKFAAVFLAYETLCDDTKRKSIDAARASRRRRVSERNRLDANRRILRDKLERDERRTTHGNNDNKTKMDDGIIARMQEEIEILRKEASTTNTAVARNARVGAEWKGNAWASVTGFSDLTEAKIPFDEFESDVLAKLTGGN